MKKLLVLLIIFSQTQLSSQNLVLNPSFELTKHCADTISNFKSNVVSWSTPNEGTTDLFNTCNTDEFIGVPKNYMGYQEAIFGDNYIGAYLYSPDDYREYIQGRFKNPLKKGVKYKVSFYVSLAEKSKYALDNIGFILSNPNIITTHWGVLSKDELKNLWLYNSSIHEISNKKLLKNSNEWVYVSKEIIAKGGENHLIIGNFEKNNKTKKRKVNKNIEHHISYYYIDLVSVEPILKKENIIIKKTKTVSKEKKEEIVFNKKYVFKNIKFKFNSTEIEENTTTELEKVLEYLNKNLETNILISGHTDNSGDTAFNQELSEKRAYSIKTYFVLKGINKNRISTIGYGNSKPLNSNETEEERLSNRRVEFIISKPNTRNN